MRNLGRGLLPTVLSLLAVFINACGPQGDSGGAGTRQGERTAPRKVLTMAMQVEPPGFIKDIVGGIQGDAGKDVQYIIHDHLTVEIEYEHHLPQLAVELPATDRGTWLVHADGTMETIWKLRPNAKWHDGQPFSSADLLFSFQLHKDPQLPTPTRYTRLMESASAPDEQTFVIHWNAPFVNANREALSGVLPKHLLEPLYLTDKANLAESRFFTTEFVGLGPYRLSRWEQGSYIEAVRFDDYYQGRPALDAVIARFVPDANAMVANILAGSVDIVLSHSTQGIDLDAAFEVQRRWEGTGNQVAVNISDRTFYADPQYQTEYARPRNGVTNLSVRRGLYHAIDRQALADAMTHGLSPVADSYSSPIDPLRSDMEAFIPQYPYDPTRASQLLAEGGWVRGQDGVLTHSPSGERFEMEIWARQGPGNEKVVTTVADDWKRVGAAMTVHVIPTALLGSREYEVTRPGFALINPSPRSYTDMAKMHSREIATAGNRWTGINYGGYINPRLDALLDQLQTTIAPRERLPLLQQALWEQMNDVAMMPLYWRVLPQLSLRGVNASRAKFSRPTLNIFEWDKEG